MNKQNFIQSGGFPLQTETLNEMQKGYDLFNGLGNIAGNFSIISGCVVTGASVSNGVVFINGEVLEFRGGQLGSDVIISEEVTAQEFEDGNERDVVYIRYATFGIGLNQYPWVNFKRPKSTVELTEQKAEQNLIDLLISRIEVLEARPASNVPIGMIAIWDQPANLIPIGWEEYLPLKGRMPIGHDPGYAQGFDLVNYGLNVLGNEGGKREHQLTKPELPNYNLTRGVGNETVQGGSAIIWSSNVGGPYVQIINSGGEDKPHNNMSPYRVVKFIIYRG
jgi:hypothetical protein